MTIKELKNKLEGLDETLDVFIEQNNTDDINSLAECASVEKIKFSSFEINKKDEPIVSCFVIKDH